MNSERITTEAELDAALAIQRARRIDGLRRQANLNYFWFAVLPCLGITCFVIAFLSERHWASVSGIVVLSLSMLLGYFQFRRQRQLAADELAKALEDSR